MLYLLSELSAQFNVLNVFRYLTFRAGGAVVTALIVAFVTGPAIIRWPMGLSRSAVFITTKGDKHKST